MVTMMPIMAIAMPISSAEFPRGRPLHVEDAKWVSGALVRKARIIATPPTIECMPGEGAKADIGHLPGISREVRVNFREASPVARLRPPPQDRLPRGGHVVQHAHW